jgi:hypothetical protein
VAQSTAANKNVEGRSVVEVELRLPNNKIIPFGPLNIVHVSSNVIESIKRSATHQLVLDSPTTDYVDSVIRFAQSQGTPKIRYRLGIGVAGKTAYLPWQEHLIVSFGAALQGMGTAAGHFVRFSLAGPLFTMSRATKVVARRGKISDIVKAIAQENGFTDFVIEPTVGEGSWIQSFVDDVDFIRKRMIPRAINDKGRGNFNFYSQDNVLHFHSPDYQAAIKDLVYYQSSNISLTQLDDSQSYLEAGASGVRLVVYDPYTAQIKEVESDPTKALRLGNVMHQLPNIAGSELNYSFHLSTNSPQEADNLAQSIYENARSQILGLKIDILRTIFLRIGDLLRITISPASSKNTVWSGIYMVTDAVYHVESGAMVSSFVVKRGEFQTSTTAPTTVDILGHNVVIDDQQAPGQPLNLKSAQSSTLTHGAGQSGATSIFIQTQDPNTLPNPTPSF